jgi:tetratricopeptide (TPR) repeat protein
MRVFFIAAFVVAMLIYSAGLMAPYHLDDGNVLTIAQTLNWSSTRSLGFASFWLNEQIALVIGPMLPWSMAFYIRVGNVLIHALAATALFWLMRELTGRALLATIAGALFLVHPIQTQAVTYITQRFESQAAMFMLFSAAAYVRFRRTGLQRWLAAALILGVGAVLTKETSLVLPLWLILIELVFLGGSAQLKKRAVYIAPLGVLAAFYIFERLPGILSGPTLRWIALDRYWLTQGPVLATYLKLSTWTHQQFLFYDFHAVEQFSWLFAGQWGLVLFVAGAGLYLLRKHPLIGFGLLSFFLLMLPVIVLPLPDLINEHRVYPSFAGLAIAAAGLYQAVNRRSVLAIFGVLIILLSMKTAIRNSEWTNQVTFLETHRAAFPNDPSILSRLASHYYLIGYVNRALETNLEARRHEHRHNTYYRQQGHLLTSINLAGIYLAKSNPEAAKIEALRAVAAKPDEPLVWRILGQVQFQLEEFDEARRSFERWIALAPGVDSLQALQAVALRLGNTSLAADVGEFIKIEQQVQAQTREEPFVIPTEYRAYFIYAMVLILLSSIVWALWTIWAAVQTLIPNGPPNLASINELRRKI